MPQGKVDATSTGSRGYLKLKVTENEDKLTSNPVDDVKSLPGADDEESQIETPEGVADEEEAVPLDSVDGRT
jgi:hypothetical protein